MSKTVIIGLGHKARQGKDYLANYVKDNYKNVHIISFAKKLYEEARNKDRDVPLLEKRRNMIFIKSPFSVNRIMFKAETISEIANYMDSRGISLYEGMDEDKDPIFLQLWGTNVRRKFWGKNYWTDFVKDEIERISEQEGEHIIIAPDTRFMNEAELIKSYQSGYYADVVRLNQDGTRFITKDRDKNHKSETELDNFVPDFTITAKTKDFDNLYAQAEKMLEAIFINEEIKK